MSKFNGIIVLIISLSLMIFEVYYLIIEPLNSGADINLSVRQYWALVIPVMIGLLILTGTSSWIGYTMITTPEPIKLTYEEAYEIAEIKENENR